MLLTFQIGVQTCPTIEGVNPVLRDSAKCIHVGDEDGDEVAV